jgi:serine protease AprX
MKKIAICLLTILSITQIIKAQSTRYVIQFTDKGNNSFSISIPSAYLSDRALARRSKYGIAIDSSDLPVTQKYIDSIRLAGAVTILNVSKWLNSVSIQTTDAAALLRINNFPFVRSSHPVGARISVGRIKTDSTGLITAPISQRENGITAGYFDYGASLAQVHIHNGEFLHNIGLHGENMIIGMLDAGYMNYLTVQAFDSARANGQILGTWDFVAREASVNEDNQHGMECLSTIAANIPGQFVGTAPKASFYLFRSEDAGSENPIEEHNWVCAAERVDSAGGDMISSSLGYSQFDNPAFDHTYADMNGNTTMAAIGADLAAKKGILVVNSAGNEGAGSWGKIITPADGDSVMAVGAVNASGLPASFTSRGPSSDGQVKPDVASLGVATVIQLPNNTIGSGNGTSFACPNIAGLTACLWQGFPEFNNMQIIDALRRSGSRATNPNDTIGFGIPDVRKATLLLLDELASSSVQLNGCKAMVKWTSKDIASMKYEIERKLSGQNIFIKVGEVRASGLTFNSQTREFEDDLGDLPAGIITYRIKQIVDSSLTGLVGGYIDTTSLNIPGNCFSGLNNFTISPNPTQSQLTIRLTTPSASENITLRIFNILGQAIVERKTSKVSGLTIFEIPVSQLPEGKYFVSVYDNNIRIGTQSLIKLK